MTKIEQIKDAIDKALKRQSKMEEKAWAAPALSSLNIRHLMNNLGAISTRYFESGVHKGGLFCSVICNNSNLLSAHANDSFQSDDENITDQARPQFTANVKKCIEDDTAFMLTVADSFDVKPEDILGPVDLYLFDADHAYESQKKAVTHYLSAMADEFLMCIDDMDFPEVAAGTKDGLAEAPVEILFEQVWKGNDHDNDGWWNGYGIWLLKKKS